jgi:hypothetical protein
MTTLRNLALSMLIVLMVVTAFLLYLQAHADHFPRSPAAIHRVRLTVLAAVIDEYAMNEGHLPATLDDLPSPALPDPGCIDPNDRPKDDYRRDPDGVRVEYTVVDARSMRYRVAIPAHTTKTGAWVPSTHVEERGTAGTSP